MQGAEFETQTGGVFDMELVGSSYDQVRDVSVSALKYGALPQTREYSGTGWKVMDVRFIFRPEEELFGKHELSFGGHLDQIRLKLYLQSTPTYWSSSYLRQAQRFFLGQDRKSRRLSSGRVEIRATMDAHSRRAPGVVACIRRLQRKYARHPIQLDRIAL